ncbi:MAG: hypothetical protein GY839_08045 [candidate division Zixibacteria bacterium]|nr:hypothetical protein [candidate division Zixibacteria bacterium]
MNKLMIITIFTLILTVSGLADNGQKKDNETDPGIPVVTFDSDYFINKTYQYIEDHKDLYHTEDPRADFPIKNVSTDSEGNVHVILYQFEDGVKVKSGVLTFRYRHYGKCYYRGGWLVKEARSIDTKHSISNYQAESIALGAVKHPDPDIPPAYVLKSELFIEKVDDVYKLIWFVSTSHGRLYGPSRELRIDAQTGTIISNISGLIK